MEKNKIKIILVGCGSMGRNHFRLLQELPEFELVAVIDPDTSVQERIGSTPWFETIQSAMHLEFAAAVLASPIGLHFEQAVQLLNAGKDLMIEKPLASTSIEAQKLNDLAKEKGRFILTGHVERFNPAFLALQREMKKWDLGKVFKYEFHRIGPYPAQPGRFGVAIDLGVHDFDLMYQLTENIPKWTFAKTTQVFHPTHEDGLVVMGELPDSTEILFNINWLSPRKQRFIRVYGEHGMLEANLFERKLFAYESNLRKNRNDQFGIQGIEYGETREISIENREPLAEELKYFAQEVQKNTNRKEPNYGPVLAVKMVETVLMNRGKLMEWKNFE